MLESIFSRNSTFWALSKHFLQQVNCFLRYLSKSFSCQRNMCSPILTQDFIVGFTWECTFANQEKIKDKSQAKNIADRLVFSRHVSDIDNLWCHIAGSSTSNK